MWIILQKEWNQFFSSLTGYIALIVFLTINGLVFFVFPETSLLDFGYASLENYFRLAPWILLFLIPTITMRSIAEEYRAGTFELLKTIPISSSQIVWGKFYGSLLIVLMALLPTIVYAFSLQSLSAVGGIDVGSTIGSYLGLCMLGAVFTAAGLCASSFTHNTVISFISGAFICLIFYTGFDAISSLPSLPAGLAYYIEMLGINFHYRSISKGVVDVRDILYFLVLIYCFILITKRNMDLR